LVASPPRNPSIAAPNEKTASVTDAARGVMCRELRKDVFASNADQLKDKKHFDVDFVLHSLSTHVFPCFPQASYGLFKTKVVLGGRGRAWIAVCNGVFSY
jgi:hypothetical protein